jgi:hypothetical protein
MADDARVGFRDVAGKESVADLAVVPVEQLAAGQPWRVFRWRQGQAHYSGWYPTPSAPAPLPSATLCSATTPRPPG